MVTILLFPGQGAQKVGMAKDLAERFPAAAATLQQIDDALGEPLTDVMWHGPSEELLKTHNTQPAILAHSAAVLAVIGDRIQGSAVASAGHSLGEYSAWVAAGALDPTDAAKLVRTRGSLMYQAGLDRPGAMSAVIGLDAATIATACQSSSNGPGEVVVAANLNTADQTVISGDPAAVVRAGEACEEAGARRVLPLKVSGAFHSPLMTPAVPGLSTELAAVSFGEARFPVVANATAELVSDSADAASLLAEQLTAPVRWVESMQLLAKSWPDARWLELGPGSVLTGLMRKIAPEVECTALGTADELEKWMSA